MRDSMDRCPVPEIMWTTSWAWRRLRRRWQLLGGADGAVYPFGDAMSHGDARSVAHLDVPIVGMAVDPVTGGYWEVGADGCVFSYGAPFHGSAGNLPLDEPNVEMSVAAHGSGYHLVASDGGVFAYGAPFWGSKGGEHLNAPVVGLAVAGAMPSPA